MNQNQTMVGPLVVSRANPRYFAHALADGSGEGEAVYLTGSHIWNNLHDGMGPGSGCSISPEPFDFNAYLDFLVEHGHNFIRLWRWEQFKSQAAGGDYHLCMTPQPWLRSGPGMAADGKPRFDLSRFDPAFFDRLRTRTSEAGARGIYVSIMLFDGFALHLSPAPDNIEGHPFYEANNINNVGIRSIVDYQSLPLTPQVQAFQEAYIRAVVDAVGDLPNVLYEVSNESPGGGTVDEAFAQAIGLGEPPDWGDSTAWQYWVIDMIQQHEKQQRYDRHPTGMTMQFPVPEQWRVNEPLYRSQADWISPGYDDEIFASGGHPMAPGSPPSRWYADPPAAEGAKVIISDTDHYAAGKGDALWAWKSFLRGHHPILIDYGLIEGFDPASPAYATFEPVRHAMGDTLRYARRINLAGMAPQENLCSTGYALVDPGKEYLVLQPVETSDPFTVSLAPGTYLLEWFHIAARKTASGEEREVELFSTVSFQPPFPEGGPAVLYLKRV